SPKLTSTRSPCGSINARERPWALKLQPIDYEWCCIDRLSPPAESRHGTGKAGCPILARICRFAHRWSRASSRVCLDFDVLLEEGFEISQRYLDVQLVWAI